MFVITAHPDPVSELPRAGFFSKPFETGALLAALERVHEGTRR
jgi:hypothetical protein